MIQPPPSLGISVISAWPVSGFWVGKPIVQRRITLAPWILLGTASPARETSHPWCRRESSASSGRSGAGVDHPIDVFRGHMRRARTSQLTLHAEASALFVRPRASFEGEQGDAPNVEVVLLREEDASSSQGPGGPSREVPELRHL